VRQAKARGKAGLSASELPLSDWRGPQRGYFLAERKFQKLQPQVGKTVVACATSKSRVYHPLRIQHYQSIEPNYTTAYVANLSYIENMDSDSVKKAIIRQVLAESSKANSQQLFQVRPSHQLSVFGHSLTRRRK
jgi:hypothetical protein